MRDPAGMELQIRTKSRLRILQRADLIFLERLGINLTAFGRFMNSKGQLLSAFEGHTGSCEGKGHHLSSNADPLSIHNTISQRISPLSTPAVSIPADGPRLHNCTQAR